MKTFMLPFYGVLHRMVFSVISDHPMDAGPVSFLPDLDGGRNNGWGLS